MSDKINIMLSIAAPDAQFDNMEKTLSKYAKVTVVGLDGYSLRGVDYFIGKKLTAAALDGADRLKGVFAYKTGVDDFPLERLAEKGVLLCNSHVNSEIIAQYAFTLAAALVARIVDFDRRMRVGDWAGEYPYWHSIFDMRVGLVGFGSIGGEIYKILANNDIPVFTIDRGRNYPSGVTTVPTLEELCRNTDMLILSLPKTEKTDKLIDAEILSLLRGKFIVNVGRSNCIDEDALYASLAGGELAGAAIDTWRQKPSAVSERLKPFDAPFDKLDNIIMSSHKAMQIKSGHARYVSDTLDNIVGVLNGRAPRNVVDLHTGY